MKRLLACLIFSGFVTQARANEATYRDTIAAIHDQFLRLEMMRLDDRPGAASLSQEQENERLRLMGQLCQEDPFWELMKQLDGDISLLRVEAKLRENSDLILLNDLKDLFAICSGIKEMATTRKQAAEYAARMRLFIMRRDVEGAGKWAKAIEQLEKSGAGGEEGTEAVDLRLMKIRYKIVDEEDKPVEKAEVHLFCYVSRFDNAQPKGTTDAEGLVTIESPTVTGALEVSVIKAGYYRTLGLDVPFEAFRKGGADAPEFMKAVLKKVKTPVAMYAKNVMNGLGGPLKLPRKDETIGYDLQTGDWVAPFGKGKIPDLLLREEGEEKYGTKFDYKLTVRFSNPHDGIIAWELPQFKGSELRSEHLAPTEGYKPEWIQTASGLPEQPSKTSASKDRNFYLRLRTVTDNTGRIVSANYGKIYGDFPSIIYYFNGTVNDRNIEFDPKKNLLENLKRSERVSMP